MLQGMNVIGYFQGQFGLGETGRLYVSAMESQSIPLCLLSADFAVNHQTSRPYEHATESKPKYDINLFCIDSYVLMPVVQKFGLDILRNRYNIGLFFWETNVIPKIRLRSLSYFDEVWVTTDYNLEALSKVMPSRVYKVTHPFQWNLQLPPSSKSSFGLAEKFTFLFCFDMNSSIKRKNPGAIIEAFRRAFGERQDVQLVIKSQNGHHHPEALREALRGIQGDSRIHWLEEMQIV